MAQPTEACPEYPDGQSSQLCSQPARYSRDLSGRWTVQFSNNLSENAIRPFAVGRKNWLFSNSVEGANASAVVCTMVEMAKAHNLNIYGYLKFLLENWHLGVRNSKLSKIACEL